MTVFIGCSGSGKDDEKKKESVLVQTNTKEVERLMTNHTIPIGEHSFPMNTVNGIRISKKDVYCVCYNID